MLGRDLPRYARHQTYQWNYDHAPDPLAVDAPEFPGDWTFCGLPVGSPLGVPAGPLLNGRWVLYYASLGFDVLTYKTVRSRQRACYPLPNLQPVSAHVLRGGEQDLRAIGTMQGSWAVSFGMPSQAPDVWRRDIEETRNQLARNKRLVVSVVGTVQPEWSLNDLAQDYARCAAWAVESGADAIEANFSCPNVSTTDGQLYQCAADAQVVAEQIRAMIGDRPLIIKIGHLRRGDQVDELLQRLAPPVDALSLTNSLATAVRDADGHPMFDGQPRGICGDAIRETSVMLTRQLHERIAAQRLPLQLIGVGGVSRLEHVRAYLEAGAHAVQIATAAMMDPGVALSIRSAAQNAANGPS